MRGWDERKRERERERERERKKRVVLFIVLQTSAEKVNICSEFFAVQKSTAHLRIESINHHFDKIQDTQEEEEEEKKKKEK